MKVFQLLSKSKFLGFMTKMNPKSGNETHNFFQMGRIQVCHNFSIGHKILRYFNDFYKLYLSISSKK